MEMLHTPELTSLIDTLLSSATRFPSKIAFSYLRDGELLESCISFQDLHKSACAFAAFLRAQNLTKKNVLLAYPPGLDFVIAFYGTIYAGFVPVPIVPPKNIKKFSIFHNIQQNSEAEAVVTTQEMSIVIDRIFQSVLYPGPCRILYPGKLALDAADSWKKPVLKKDDIAFLQYTSGSTSKPKGVMVSHGNLLHNCKMLKNYFELDDRDILGSWLPHYHDMGLIGNILLNVHLGSHCYLMAPRAFVEKPIRWLNMMSKLGVTYTGAPNFGYQLCVDKISNEQCRNLDLNRWRNGYCGSEPIRAETVNAFMHRFKTYGLAPQALYPCYGMAEATLIISGGRVNDAPRLNSFDSASLQSGVAVQISPDNPGARKLVGCGKVHPEQQLKIVDPESRRELSVGNVGEIWLSGPSVCAGYYKQPELSDHIFCAKLANANGETYVRSGDLGFLDQDNELYISSRIKDLIIVRGRNLYPQDIELEVAKCHDALVLDAGACFSVEVRGEEKLVVAHEINRSHIKKYNFEEILNAVKSTVSEIFNIEIAAFILLRPGRVLKTSSGKIMRSATKALYLSESIDFVEQWLNPTLLDKKKSHDYIEIVESIDFSKEQLNQKTPAMISE